MITTDTARDQRVSDEDMRVIEREMRAQITTDGSYSAFVAHRTLALIASLQAERAARVTAEEALLSVVQEVATADWGKMLQSDFRDLQRVARHATDEWAALVALDEDGD